MIYFFEQDSFSSLLKIRSDDQTPVENFIPSDRDLLTKNKDDEDDGGSCSPARRGRTAVWSLLACLGTVSLVGAILGIIYAIVTASGGNTNCFKSFDNVKKC